MDTPAPNAPAATTPAANSEETSAKETSAEETRSAQEQEFSGQRSSLKEEHPVSLEGTAREYRNPGDPDWEREERYPIENISKTLVVTYDAFGAVDASLEVDEH